MRATVVIPTYNRPQRLTRLLDCLAEQRTDALLEVLVCDDGSGPDTAKAVEACRDRVPGLRHLWQEDLGFRAGQARNMGIREAQGEVLIFVDDDLLLSPDFVEHHVAAHRDAARPSVVLGLRHRTMEPPADGCPTVEQMLRGDPDDRIEPLGLHGERLPHSPHPWFFVYSCNFSVPNRPDDIWFDHRFVGWGMEDIELGYRLFHGGYGVQMQSGARVLHLEDPAPRDPFRCVERGLKPQYDSYVRNMVVFLEKYPHDGALRALLANDLRWYVRDDSGEHWVKNGRDNDADAVIALVRADLASERAAQRPKLASARVSP